MAEFAASFQLYRTLRSVVPLTGGTEGSNPSCSSEESAANPESVDQAVLISGGSVAARRHVVDACQHHRSPGAERRLPVVGVEFSPAQAAARRQAAQVVS